MTLSPRRRAASIIALLLLATLTRAGSAHAMAPQALGPRLPEPRAAGGYIGQLSIAPLHGPEGTAVAVSAQDLPPNQDFDLVWRTVKGAWKAENGEYHGRAYTPIGYRIAILHSDAQGRATAHFTAPEDFGFVHDIVLQQNGRLLTQASFSLDMEVHITPKSGPPGTPIHVAIEGIGWRELESSWLLRYDNNFTGWISAVTTAGKAKFTIPATGAPGVHVLEVMHGEFTFPYLNPQQNPDPGRPRFAADFTVTPGDAVLPPQAASQRQKLVRRLPGPGRLIATPAFGPIGQNVTVRGAGFTPGQSYALDWATVTGNRVGGNGWTQTTRKIAVAAADAAGAIAFRFAAPDDLGGAHDLVVDDGGKRKRGSFWITPSALALAPSRGPVGTNVTIHLRGVGWTETANIYTVVYDNSYIGYACGFNSQGDVTIYLKATGRKGWHFIDLYPAIYKGKEIRPNNFRIPQLTYQADHPGEDLPAFHFAFDVTDAEKSAQN